VEGEASRSQEACISDLLQTTRCYDPTVSCMRYLRGSLKQLSPDAVTGHSQRYVAPWVRAVQCLRWVRRPMVIGRTRRACQSVCVSAGNVILKTNKWNEAKRHCTMAPFFSANADVKRFHHLRKRSPCLAGGKRRRPASQPPPSGPLSHSCSRLGLAGGRSVGDLHMPPRTYAHHSIEDVYRVEEHCVRRAEDR
jgi:hypothetical protein